MSNYSMAQVETLTGIKAHTLRVWERRYDFLQPSRTETNIRYYSDQQLRKLMNIGILTRNGHRISKIDKEVFKMFVMSQDVSRCLRESSDVSSKSSISNISIQICKTVIVFINDFNHFD